MLRVTSYEFIEKCQHSQDVYQPVFIVFSKIESDFRHSSIVLRVSVQVQVGKKLTSRYN